MCIYERERHDETRPQTNGISSLEAAIDCTAQMQPSYTTIPGPLGPKSRSENPNSIHSDINSPLRDSQSYTAYILSLPLPLKNLLDPASPANKLSTTGPTRHQLAIPSMAMEHSDIGIAGRLLAGKFLAAEASLGQRFPPGDLVRFAAAVASCGDVLVWRLHGELGIGTRKSGGVKDSTYLSKRSDTQTWRGRKTP